MSLHVYCCRCEDVVETEPAMGEPLWCSTCGDEILGPPTSSGDRSVRWAPSGLWLADESLDPRPTPPPRRSVGVAALGAAMTATFEIIYGRKDAQPTIEVHDDDPDEPDDLELYLDEETPEASWVRIRNHPVSPD